MDDHEVVATCADGVPQAALHTRDRRGRLCGPGSGRVDNIHPASIQKARRLEHDAALS